MFPIAVRIWTGEKMLYPTLFSISYDPSKRKSNIRTKVKSGPGRFDFIEYDTADYMLKTPWKAINGDIFELDLVFWKQDNKEQIGLIWYDEEGKCFQARTTEGDVRFNPTGSCEIAGNFFECNGMMDGIKVPENGPVNAKVKTTISTERPKNKAASEKETTSPVKQGAEKAQGNKNLPEEKRVPLAKTDATKRMPAPEAKKTGREKTIAQKVIDNPVPRPVLKAPVPTVKQKPLEKIQRETLSQPDAFFENTGGEEDMMAVLSVFSNENQPNSYKIHTLYIRGKEQKEFEVSKVESDSKKIYLLAALSVMKKFVAKSNFKLTVSCNLPYVVMPFLNGWIEKWKENNWIKDNGTEVQHSNLWNELYGLSTKYKTEWKLKE